MNPDPQAVDLSEEELRELIPQLQQITDKYKRTESIQKALFDISELASSVSDLPRLYKAVHEIIADLMPAENFFIALREDNDLVNFVYFVDEFDELKVNQIPAEQLKGGLTGYLLKTGEAIFLRQESFEQHIKDMDVDVLGTPPVDFIGVPLKRGAEIAGAMVVQSYNDDFRYNDDHLELLMFVSQNIMTTVDRVTHRETTEKTIRERTKQLRAINQELQEEIRERQRIESLQQALFEISELSANVGKDMVDFYSDLHDILSRLLSAPNCYIATINPESKKLEFPYFSDQVEDSIDSRELGRGLTEYIIRTGQAALIDALNAAELSDQGELAEDIASIMYRTNNCWLGSPLVVEGEVYGVVAIQTYGDERHYNDKDLELLRFVSHHIAVAMQRRRTATEITRYNEELSERVKARTEELNRANVDLQKQIDERKEIELKLIHDAHHDSLTDLPNRVMFINRLSLALANKRRHRENNFAVLFVDLDRFKMINDTLGHQAGDEFLIEVSKRIQQCIRGHDLLARLGGDEFVVLLDDFEMTSDVEEVASRIIDTISRPFVLNNKEMYSGASIGIAFIEPWYQDADEVIRDADSAMYQAKSQGRGRYLIFDQGMREQLLRKMELESEFRRTLRESRFECYSQPIFDLAQNTVCYSEMYIRWQHPNLGKVKREQFWQVAEHSGLTVEIDNYVLDKALDTLKNKKSDDPDYQCRVGVNLSIHHLLQPDLVEELLEKIKSADVSPEHMVFEFDENDLNRRSQFMLPTIRKLKQAGFTLVLDNFGSGLASLSYLYSYPFDFVKVDHRFIRSLPRSEKNLKMVQSVKIMSEHLGFKLIAEGIRTDKQMEALRAIGCEFGQGNYLAPPLQIEDMPSDLELQLNLSPDEA